MRLAESENDDDVVSVLDAVIQKMEVNNLLCFSTYLGASCDFPAPGIP
jgi:hypothetical protein